MTIEKYTGQKITKDNEMELHIADPQKMIIRVSEDGNVIDCRNSRHIKIRSLQWGAFTLLWITFLVCLFLSYINYLKQTQGVLTLWQYYYHQIPSLSEIKLSPTFTEQDYANLIAQFKPFDEHDYVGLLSFALLLFFVLLALLFDSDPVIRFDRKNKLVYTYFGKRLYAAHWDDISIYAGSTLDDYAKGDPYLSLSLKHIDKNNKISFSYFMVGAIDPSSFQRYKGRLSSVFDRSYFLRKRNLPMQVMQFNFLKQFMNEQLDVQPYQLDQAYVALTPRLTLGNLVHPIGGYKRVPRSLGKADEALALMQATVSKGEPCNISPPPWVSNSFFIRLVCLKGDCVKKVKTMRLIEPNDPLSTIKPPSKALTVQSRRQATLLEQWLLYLSHYPIYRWSKILFLLPLLTLFCCLLLSRFNYLLGAVIAIVPITLIYLGLWRQRFKPKERTVVRLRGIPRRFYRYSWGRGFMVFDDVTFVVNQRWAALINTAIAEEKALDFDLLDDHVVQMNSPAGQPYNLQTQKARIHFGYLIAWLLLLSSVAWFSDFSLFRNYASFATRPLLNNAPLLLFMVMGGLMMLLHLLMIWMKPPRWILKSEGAIERL